MLKPSLGLHVQSKGGENVAESDRQIRALELGSSATARCGGADLQCQHFRGPDKSI